MSDVRVRYAPSPTGMQHIGGVRTALFNYLYARSQGGKFILRLEDTDRTRFDEKYVQNLYDTMDWLGIDWDEGGSKGGEYGPYVQSERFELYKKYAMQLIENGEPGSRSLPAGSRPYSRSWASRGNRRQWPGTMKKT